jgi:hypothetical protein
LLKKDEMRRKSLMTHRLEPGLFRSEKSGNGDDEDFQDRTRQPKKLSSL